jgi:CheY-like chemotaxis protein
MERRKKSRPSGKPADRREPRRRVLVVDDDLDFVQSMATLLRAKGHEVSFAINATVALSVARSFRPDTVMLDIKLPNGDGRLLAAQLRREVRPDMHIVCVTGNAHEDPRESIKHGCDAHYLKPLEPAVIEKLLS